MSKQINYQPYQNSFHCYNNYNATEQYENYEQAQISFDHLVQKNSIKTSPSVDKIFDQIQLNQKSNKKILYEDSILINKSKQNLVIEQADKKNKKSMYDKTQRQNFSKRLQLQLTKGKDRHKKSLNKLDSQKQQLIHYKIQNQHLKTQIKQFTTQNTNLKQTINKMNQLLTKQTHNEKQLQHLKSQYKRQKNEHQKTKQQNKLLQIKVNELIKINEQLQKKLRIKQKQFKNMQQKQKDRSKYYQQFFGQKFGEIQKLNIQINKKSQHIYQIQQQHAKQKQQISKQMTQILQEKQIFQAKVQELNQQISQKYEAEVIQATHKMNKIITQNEQKTKVIQRTSRLISQCVQYLQQYLKESSQKTSNFSSINTNTQSNQYRSNQIINKMDQSYIKYLLNLILQTIQKNKMIIKRKDVQIKNFKELYSTQIDNLDHKMEYLVNQNKSLKLQYQTINQSFNQGHLLKQKIKLNQINSLKQFMSTKINNFSKIRQQILQQRPEQPSFVDKIEKARQIYNEVSLRNQSAGTLKQKNRYLSQTNLHKRQRRSLSWKKPSTILKQYI